MVLPEDLMQYGLIPEFVGRLPVISAIHQLTREDLITILTEPRNALTKQFHRFFSFDGIELHFADDALGAIADKALERNTGARGLRSILEEVLLEVSSSFRHGVTSRNAWSPRRPSRRTSSPPSSPRRPRRPSRVRRHAPRPRPPRSSWARSPPSAASAYTRPSPISKH